MPPSSNEPTPKAFRKIARGTPTIRETNDVCVSLVASWLLVSKSERGYDTNHVSGSGGIAGRCPDEALPRVDGLSIGFSDKT